MGTLQEFKGIELGGGGIIFKTNNPQNKENGYFLGQQSFKAIEYNFLTAIMTFKFVDDTYWTIYILVKLQSPLCLAKPLTLRMVHCTQNSLMR